MDENERYHNSGPEDPGDGKTWPCLFVLVVILAVSIIGFLKITGAI